MIKTESDQSPWYASGRWNVSPFAWEDEVRGKMKLPRRVHIRETTFRQGGDQAGINLRIDEKVKLAGLLAEIGVEELEIGYPSAVKEHLEALRALASAGVPVRKSAMPLIHREWDFSKATEEALRMEVDTAIDAGADHVKISMVPGSDWPLKGYKMKREEIIPRALVMFDQAKERGIPYGIGPFDILRAPLEWTRDAFKEFSKANIDRAFIYEDGVGTPPVMHFFVEQIRSAVGHIPICVHCHNDWGLGTANTLAAIESGAEWAEATVNGYGIRAGNASFEEVVCALEMLYGVDTGVKLDRLYGLSKTLQQMTGVKIQPHKPIVGDHAFSEKHEAKVRRLLQRDYAWQPIDACNPEVVGNSYRITWERGTLEPDDALRLKLNEMGLKYSEAELDDLKRRLLDEVSPWHRRYLTTEELEAICRAMLRTQV